MFNITSPKVISHKCALRAADIFNEKEFLEAMSVVIAYAAYLGNAQCFALLPMATLIRRTGNENGAILDYDLDLGAVTLTATRPYRCAAFLSLLPSLPPSPPLSLSGAQTFTCITHSLGVNKCKYPHC
jgi:hypothetical protein